jgi:hypothetical protein
VGKRPHLLNRFISGVLHPLIHTGYGIEFGIPGILAEGMRFTMRIEKQFVDVNLVLMAGLAQTCVHPASSPMLMVESLFDLDEQPKNASAFAQMSSMLPSLSTSQLTTPLTASASETHALTILARVLKDPLFRPRNPDDIEQSVADVLNDQERVDTILRYTAEWLSGAAEHVEEKLEEIAWLNTLIYGVGGFTKARDFNADFFLWVARDMPAALNTRYSFSSSTGCIW